MKKLLAAATGALTLVAAGPAFAERIYLSCAHAQGEVITVILDTDRFELDLNGRLYTREGRVDTGLRDDGTRWTTRRRLISIDKEVVRFADEPFDRQMTLSRVTGQLTLEYSQFQCKRVAGPAF